MELFAESQFDLAYAAAGEGYRLAVDTGYSLGGHVASTMAAMETAWGREEAARGHAEEAVGFARRRGLVFLENLAEWTLGFIDMTAGRHAAAADRLLRLTSGHPDIHRWSPV